MLRRAKRLIALGTLAVIELAGCSAGNGPYADSGFQRTIPTVTLIGWSGPTAVDFTSRNPCEVIVDFQGVGIGQTGTAIVGFQMAGTHPIGLSQPEGELDPSFGLSFREAPYPSFQLFDLGLSFRPSRSGQVRSDLRLQADAVIPTCSAPTPPATTSTVVVALIGEGIEPQLILEPDVLDFGNTLTNTTATKSVTLSNRSNAPITGITATIGGGDQNLFTVDDVPAGLAVNASAVVRISYMPVALETRSLANVLFTSDDGQFGTLELFGEPVGVALYLGPNPINFGFESLHSTAIGCTTVTNQSNISVSIENPIQFNTAGGAYAVASTDDSVPPVPISFPVVIAGGSSAEVCFSFTPSLTQQYTGQVTLQTDDPSGTNPVLQVTGWGGGPEITCTPMSLAFDETQVLAASTLPVICTNTGTTIPTMTSLIIPPPLTNSGVFTATFAAVRYPGSVADLDAGESVEVDVSYAPTATGADLGTLFIKNNGGQGRTLEIPLSGHGLDAPPCQFALSDTSLDFGDILPGDFSTAKSFEIQNIGSNYCLVTGLAITDDATRSFHILSTSLQPDATTGRITIPAPDAGGIGKLSVSLQFEPTQAAPALAANVTFAISDPSAPHQVVLLTGSSGSN